MSIFTKKKHLANTKGKTAEEVACKRLETAGYKIITTNYRAPRGEIDIIATTNNTYVFVEVRFRSNRAFTTAAESIAHKKQQHIIHAATHYLQKHHLWEKVPCRFDTICIDQHTGSNDYQLEWSRNAFGINI